MARQLLPEHFDSLTVFFKFLFKFLIVGIIHPPIFLALSFFCSRIRGPLFNAFGVLDREIVSLFVWPVCIFEVYVAHVFIESLMGA
jgi:hypothetical protein